MHLHCAEDKMELRHCNLCTDSGLELEDDAQLPINCLEFRRHWNKALSKSSENVMTKQKRINIIELIDTQVLRLGPPPPPPILPSTSGFIDFNF